MSFLEIAWSDDGHVSARLPCGHTEAASEDDPGWDESPRHPGPDQLSASLLRKVARHDCAEHERRLTVEEPPF